MEVVRLSQDHSSRFFWPRQPSGKHVARCNEHREAFLKFAQAVSLEAKFCAEQERGCLFLILLGLVNYIVRALPPLIGKHRRAGVLVINSVMLPSAGV